MEQALIDNWMETRSGARFHFLNPQPDQIKLEDIALALSRACRYGGHTTRFYSVAEHCCIMSDWVLAQEWGTPLDALTALHHDDAEAYIGDLPRPAKQNIPQFKDVEIGIDKAISRRFGTIHPFPNWLKQADTEILVDERSQVMAKSDNEWFIDRYQGLGVQTWNFKGRFSWVVRREWLKRHFHLNALIFNSFKNHRAQMRFMGEPAYT